MAPRLPEVLTVEATGRAFTTHIGLLYLHVLNISHERGRHWKLRPEKSCLEALRSAIVAAQRWASSAPLATSLNATAGGT